MALMKSSFSCIDGKFNDQSNLLETFVSLSFQKHLCQHVKQKINVINAHVLNVVFGDCTS